MENIYFLAGTFAVIVQIIVYIKFFQIASDIKEMKTRFFKINNKKNKTSLIVAELVEEANIEAYLGNYNKEKELLLRIKYRLEKGLTVWYDENGYLSTDNKIEQINIRLNEINQIINLKTEQQNIVK